MKEVRNKPCEEWESSVDKEESLRIHKPRLFEQKQRCEQPHTQGAVKDKSGGPAVLERTVGLVDRRLIEY